MKIRIKKTKIKKHTEEEYYFLKEYFVYSNTIEALRKIDLDKELFKFIDEHFHFEILEHCSEYGFLFFRLNFSKMMERKNECFISFIKLDVDEYIFQMRMYKEGKSKLV